MVVPDEAMLLTLEQLATRCGVDLSLVEVLIEHGVIECVRQRPRLVAREMTLQVNKVARLQHDLGVNVQGATVILQLLERIEELECQLLTRR